MLKKINYYCSHMAEEKKAKKVFTLSEIKYNEKNQWLGVFACIPVVGLILMFVEKDDNFVRYIGAEYTILWVIYAALSLVPLINIFIGFIMFIVIVIGMAKSYKGERFDIPGVSDLALKLLSAVA